MASGSLLMIRKWITYLRSCGRGGFSPDQLLPQCVRRHAVGHRRTMLVFGVLCFCILLVNTVFTITILARQGWSDGIGTLYEERCSKVNSLNTVAHLIINAMGAVLLAGGNFSTQCIAAPNRNEVDAAHQHGRTFDIGTTSANKTLATKPLFLKLCQRMIT